ncbi:hypothetical protein [Actinocorallia longicatena]|uniref:PemK-like, MazF-like toxin of type II toxin-antitoxin system n=1 Tax=Actinocorallia longicatena TaxID=111803 RepID=A0ABP6QMV8_9ACTN
MRLFVLVAWEAPLGEFVRPVGVVGVVGCDGEDRHHSWLPLTYERSAQWRSRLETGCDLDVWTRVGQAAELEPAADGRGLRSEVEGAVDELIVGLAGLFGNV